jgi:endonuclease YncB( thermonuclease family)
LGIVINARGQNVNVELIKNGLAVYYSQQSGCTDFRSYENDAKKRKKNVWSDPNFCMPWDFRKKKCKTSVSVLDKKN